MKQRRKMMKSRKRMMILITALFVFCGALFLTSTVSMAGPYDYAFSGRVYYDGDPAPGAKVYLTGYFECWNDPPNKVHWTVKKTFTANANGYFSGVLTQEKDFTKATLTAKYFGYSSYTVTIQSPSHNNTNIIFYINPPDVPDDPPCPGYPMNCP
jgi:hypothetical protein